MKKARFDTPQEPVSYKVFDDTYYIQICLNGKYIEEEDNNISCWEYDFNEIVTDQDIDIADVIEHPENYLNYTVKILDPIKQMRADIDYLLLLNEI